MCYQKGSYTLYHSLVNDKDSFKLKAADVEYQLTTTEKNPPIHIDGDLVGSFSYKINNEEKFSLKSEVSSKEEGLVSTITLKEGNTDFTTSNLSFSDDSVTFKVESSSSGNYIKGGVSYTFSYSEEQDKWTLTDSTNTYELEKKNERETKEGYFYNNFIKASNEHISMTIKSEVGMNKRYVCLSELDEGGKKNIWTFFVISNNGDSLTNENNITGNIIFTSGSSFEFRHSVNNGVDKIDFYKDNQLLYSNLTIETIE